MNNINVTRSSMPPFEEYCEEIKDLWDSRWLTHEGAKNKQLQAELEHYLGAEHIELLVNGHMAIELSLQAFGLEGEVITTPFTFASTTQAIIRSGLTPVFCDIDPVTFDLDPAEIETLITPRTCAIVPVHVYGTVCDVEAIDRIAKKHGLKVIYDAAHAFGVTYKGCGIGSFGDAACFSFHATKVFHSIEGGGACFHDKEFGEKLYRLKFYGQSGPEAVVDVGTNAKMHEFSAAMGLCNLRHVDEEIEKRRLVAQRYDEHLKSVPGIQLKAAQEAVRSNYAYYPVVFDGEIFGADRDAVQAALKGHNIMARKYFYPLTSAFACYHNRFDPAQTPIAQRISQQVLTLPLYPDLPLEMVDRICEIVVNCKV
ncbi:MAG: DegT/DnrJ/EryC1/StrS family aminotransferase [Clostridiales bacterium]|nr:DegT/DnrJ/EryC1/StrS family aminotransferase [Clostridiales bacterium]